MKEDVGIKPSIGVIHSRNYTCRSTCKTKASVLLFLGNVFVVVCFAVPLQGVAWGMPPRYLSEARSTPGRSGRL